MVTFEPGSSGWGRCEDHFNFHSLIVTSKTQAVNFLMMGRLVSDTIH
jgi:hypothetical protein